MEPGFGTDIVSRTAFCNIPRSNMTPSIPYSGNSTVVWASTHDTNVLHLLCVAKEIGTTHAVPENKIQQLYAGYEIPRLGCVEAESDTGSLRVWLINLGECERVLFTTETHSC